MSDLSADNGLCLRLLYGSRSNTRKYLLRRRITQLIRQLKLCLTSPLPCSYFQALTIALASLMAPRTISTVAEKPASASTSLPSLKEKRKRRPAESNRALQSFDEPSRNKRRRISSNGTSSREPSVPMSPNKNGITNNNSFREHAEVSSKWDHFLTKYAAEMVHSCSRPSRLTATICAVY